jgi:hypothetical protein
MTEVNNNDGAKGDETVDNSRDGRAGDQINVEIDQWDNDAEGAVTTGSEMQATMERIAADNDDRRRVNDDIGRESSQEGTHRPADEDDSFYTAKETVATGATSTRRARAMSEAPSVANPNKNKTRKSKEQGRKE